VEGVLLDERHEVRQPAPECVRADTLGAPHGVAPRTLAWVVYAGRELAERVVVVVEGETDLPHVVGALDAASGVADLLDRWKQQSDEDADDRNDHQQLDEREARPKPCTFHESLD